MLILTRKPGQSVCIDLMEDVDPSTPIGDVFSHGPIEIRITHIRNKDVKLGFKADARFLILRLELYQRRHACVLDGGIR